MPSSKVAVFGVPTAAGGRASGLERGPFALREAGLLRDLRALGPRVVHLSDLSLFPYRDDPDHPHARNAEVVECAVRAAADEMTRALDEGFTIVLGGDCTLVAGTVAGASRKLGQPVGLIYIDADADLNTPDTSPSGYLNGMALALALGRGPEAVTSAGGPPPAVVPDHVALVGFRAVDPGERPASAARRLGMRVAAALALDGVGNEDGPILVHLDVDVIDAAEMPAKQYLTPGSGLAYAEVSDLLTAIVASPRVIALEVTEYDPSRDPQGEHARKIVDLIVRAAGRRLHA
jgi:arginase